MVTLRKPSHERRREIAGAVLHLIGARGAPALTAATIAAEVGVTPGALFRHFPNLDAILEGAVDLAIEHVDATFPAATLPPVERLRALVLARIEVIRARPGLAWLLLSEQVYLTVPAPAVERLRALVQRSRAFLVEALHDGVRDGDLRTDLDPAAMLVLVTGCVHALAARGGVHCNSGSAPITPPNPTDVVDTLLALLANR